MLRRSGRARVSPGTGSSSRLLREAVWLVENGVASPETVDEIVRDGLARRWRYTGPFQTAALGGAATFERVANTPLAGAFARDVAARFAAAGSTSRRRRRGRCASGGIADWPPTCAPTRERRAGARIVSGPLPNVAPIRREPLAAEVARRLVDYLLVRRDRAGGRMPSERQLAEAFGVGRSAVREAIAALTLIGLIEVRHGDGTYLKRPDSPLLPQVVEWGLLLGEQRTIDLVEARQKIEVDIAGLAAQRRTDEDLADLARILGRMEWEAREARRRTRLRRRRRRVSPEARGDRAQLGAARRALQHPGAAAGLDRAGHRRRATGTSPMPSTCRSSRQCGRRMRARPRRRWMRICARRRGGLQATLDRASRDGRAERCGLSAKAAQLTLSILT